jgi:hypothetical protein
MISVGMLKREFRKQAIHRVIYRRIIRATGSLHSIPVISYEDTLLTPVVIRRLQGQHADSLRGTYVSGDQEVTWNPDPTALITVKPGDRINIGGVLDVDGHCTGGEDYEIEGHHSFERIPGFILQKFQITKLINGEHSGP